ncbi:outer membrane protein assembly factor BamB [Gallaecimonas sp. GXIMD4217]|uniref:outer membrane protein assembly factor BamB n=1 Tax=Gallaecimonas sp. GXIMD4217 TaxID=3131927 RepID=UPI00311AD3CC
MMKLAKWAGLIGLGALALAGCSSTDEDLRKPAELVDFSGEVKADVLWSTSVGDGIGPYFSNLAPVMAYDKLYAASREGVVKALDRNSGKTLWQVDLGDADGLFEARDNMRLSGGVSAGFGKIYIGSENGVVYALDAESGELAWQATVPGEAMAAPVPESGLVLVNTTSGKLVALDADNGQQRWMHEQNLPSLTLRGASEPTTVSGAAVFGTPAGKLAAVFVENGRLIWEQAVSPAKGENVLELLRDVDATPVVVGPIAYAVAYNGELVAIELRSGRVLWKRDYSSYRSMVVVGYDLLLVDDRGYLYALDRRNGLEKWSQPMLENRRVTAPTVVGSKVVVGDFEGYLHWFDLGTGELLGRKKIDSSGLYARPLLMDDKVVVQSRDGDVALVSLD